MYIAAAYTASDAAGGGSGSGGCTVYCDFDVGAGEYTCATVVTVEGYGSSVCDVATCYELSDVVWSVVTGWN